MKWKDALTKLGECESELRRLLAEAAKEGDYGSVLRIAGLAQAVSALVAEGRGTARPAAVPSDPSTNGSPHGTTAAHAGGRTARASVDAYPRFFRRGNELVKVGWSKKERKEYNHRASRSAVDAVAAAVRQVGARGRLFTGDKLLPLKNPTDGSRIADYQAYVALAWLKELAVVKQTGRKAGYILSPDKQVDSMITAAWPELAEWQG